MTQHVFLDVETTGLDARVDNLLEIGLMYVDNMRVVSKASWVLWYDSNNIENLHPAVQKMHTENGLFDDCMNSSYSQEKYGQLEQEILLWLDSHNIFSKDIPLTGNTVSFDRSFLKRYLPEVNSAFHYRVQDISSIKYFLTDQLVLDDDYFKKNRPERPEWMKDHRVSSCLWDSFEDFKSCQEVID